MDYSIGSEKPPPIPSQVGFQAPQSDFEATVTLRTDRKSQEVLRNLSDSTLVKDQESSSHELSLENELPDSIYETSSSVEEACDSFFNEVKILKKERVDAAIEKVFKAIILADIDEEEVKGVIRENLELLSSENTDHHFLIGDHEFHFSLVNDIHDEHQIEIYQKIGFLGQGAFGKVSEFKNLDTSAIYASKQASPRDGMPLYEAEIYYDVAINLVNEAKTKLENATSEEERALASQELKEAESAVINIQPYIIESKAAEKDINKEIKNQKLYNPDPHHPHLGIQPRYHKISSNLGSRYMIEKGKDADELTKMVEAVFIDGSDEVSGKDYEDLMNKHIQLNKQIVNSLVSGLNYILIEKGMCHSDIKPANILFKGGGDRLIDPDFQIYHADFGGDKSIKKIISKLSDPGNEIPFEKLVISTASYTSKKHIEEMNDLIGSIQEKVLAGKTIDQDQEHLKDLIIKSCQFSLGVTLFEICTGSFPDVESFQSPGVLFGNDTDGNSVYQKNLQVLVDSLSQSMVFPAAQETKNTILRLLGLGTDFEIVNKKVVLQ